MPMFALATIPLINILHITVNDVHKVWFADDACGAGKITKLREWWNQLNTRGPRFGYFTILSRYGWSPRRNMFYMQMQLLQTPVCESYQKDDHTSEFQYRY